MRSPRASTTVALSLLLLAPAAVAAQEAVPDAVKAALPAPTAEDRAKALEAFRAILASYRDAKGLEVESSVRVSTVKDGETAQADPVEGRFLFASDRRAVVNLRGYEMRFAGGTVLATHASNPLAYLEVSDHGSPYYALFNAFQALPFPELALALGEDDPGEVAMQLLPQIPNVQLVRVLEEETDGQVYSVLLFESDDATEELRLSFDPDTKFVEHVRGTLRSGDMVEEGAALVFEVRSKVKRPKEAPGDAAFTLDVASRQKVDGLAALIDQSEEAIADKEVEALKPGEPAPDLALPMARRGEDAAAAGEWSLVAARRKPVVVDFWATWCGPCRAAMPEMARLAAEFAGRAEVMLVNSAEQGTREEREERIRGVLKDRAPDLACVLDLDGAAARRWLVRAFPTTFLVAPDGKIAGMWEGSSPRSQKELREKLEALCAPVAVPAGGGAKPASDAPAPGAGQ